MQRMNKCLKEWNAIIEALGQGKQTILIRNYKTNVKKFLLYPTVNYALKDDYLKSLQDKHKKYSGLLKINWRVIINGIFDENFFYVSRGKY